MRTRTITAALTLPILLMGSGRLLPGDVRGHTLHPVPVLSAPPTSGIETAELRLLKSLADRNAVAVALAQECRARVVRPELHGLCDEIAERASIDGGLLAIWIEDWHHRPYEPDQGTAVFAAQGPADAFEVDFLTSMLRENEAMLALAHEAEERTGHAELAGHCRRTIERIEDENRRLRRWRCEWHGPCGEASR